MSTTVIRFQSTDFQPTTVEDERASASPLGSFLAAKITAYEANPYNSKMTVKLSGNFVYTVNNMPQGQSKPVLVSMPLQLCELPSEEYPLSAAINVNAVVNGLGGLQLAANDPPAHIIVKDNVTDNDAAGFWLEPIGTWYLWKANVPQSYKPSTLPVTIAGTGFRGFAKLPPELREEIWKLSILEAVGTGRHVTVQIKRTVTHKSDTVQQSNPTLKDKETISTWAATTLFAPRRLRLGCASG